MLKNILILYVHIYLCIAKDFVCYTPLQKSGRCVSFEECPEFLNALAENEVDNRTLNFIVQSKCGCGLSNPSVCCGPLPTEEQYNNSSTKLLQDIDPDSLEDSSLAPDDLCGTDFSLINDKIVGGNDSNIGEFPWMALLWYRKHGTGELNYLCGGSLINRRYVLSAAHCVTGPAYTSYGVLEFVRLGEHDVRKSVDCADGLCGDLAQDIQVLHAYPHPEYNSPKKNHDISLIRLAKRVKYTDFIRPICLDRSGKWAINDDVTVSGWGKTLLNLQSPVKLKVTLPIADPSVCFQRFQRFYLSLNEGHLCLGGNKVRTDSCTGDSGGPAMRVVGDGRWQAIAVVSFGNGCGLKGWPAVYTTVSRYYSWILDTLRLTNLCPSETEVVPTRLSK